ncbi:Holliday junction resolvase RuvX [Arcanobacterium canis]
MHLPEFRRGVRISVDVGMARVGVAKCDSAGILATPLATLARGKNDFGQVARWIDEFDAIEVVVGLPLNMDGTEGKSAKECRRWARRLSKRVNVPIRLVDERMSTVTAHRQLHEAGRAEISHRAVIDQVAAVVILESALQFEKNTGREPGELIERTNDV